ncbi:hypothetical protein AGMMS49593_02120 [Endomicrobiia bacterium]|nr:hypothetical protein AGMMS49593_02120 [Endomicrobiia bacterium]
MKSLKNSFNIHPNKKTSDKEFDQLLCTLEERHEFVLFGCGGIHVCSGDGDGACGEFIRPKKEGEDE